MKGVGPKSSVCPSKPGKPNFLAGYPGIFSGISWSRPKSLRNNFCVQFPSPTCLLCWPPLFFALVTPLEKCSVLQSDGHSTELGEGQLQDGPLHRVWEGNSFSKSLWKKVSNRADFKIKDDRERSRRDRRRSRKDRRRSRKLRLLV